MPSAIAPAEKFEQVTDPGDLDFFVVTQKLASDALYTGERIQRWPWPLSAFVLLILSILSWLTLFAIFRLVMLVL